MNVVERLRVIDDYVGLAVEGRQVKELEPDVWHDCRQICVVVVAVELQADVERSAVSIVRSAPQR